MNNIPRLLQSSKNPEKISLTIKGLAPFIVLMLGLFGVDAIKESDIMELITSIGVALSAGVSVYGLLRKLYIKIK